MTMAIPMQNTSTRHARGTDLHINVRHILFALSDALDLVGIDDVAHGKRVGIMAAECARKAGDSTAEISALFDLGLLHDIGVSSSITHDHLVQEFDWNDAQNHCEIGYGLLNNYSRLTWAALPVKYHHTRWDCLPVERLGESVATRANLIYLTDRVDGLAAAHYADGSLLMSTQAIRQFIEKCAGSYFSPALVEMFLDASRSEAFWLSLEPRSIQAYMSEMFALGDYCSMALPELKQVAEIFSRIVDAKSPFTAEHSHGVASLAKHIGQRMSVSPENCDKLEIAGLLHDIGKLRVPDDVLDKPGKLDERERKIMNSHSFETYQILRCIPGLEDISRWASCHHEEPNGNGYPFHIDARTLELEARILRVADIFQAMVQNRPYRRGLSQADVRLFMADLCAQGAIEREIFDAVDSDLPAAYKAALPSLAPV
ncbi:HD-GYP domain-containing protein [Propionivibrio dicarboxylicus]|uniref:HD domain-containing protein n=1 Tax=Propionivibrio dicarboxylicus TaxID=83767 RepID=A0A1G8IVX4_9RHOO|nr:HD domain-containing phosphohydrolase [Propionivibrio dicarboxylicus]SDI23071.1 HD domain-containing protein [Propionivibrio dicarboxylicus]